MTKEEYPRVLVISHNVFSTTSNMGKTMAAFFFGWPSDKIAQIYFQEEVPDTNICEKYYRITDFDMLESFLKLKKPGEELTTDDIKWDIRSNRIDNGIRSNIYQLGRKRKPYMCFLRNFLWSTNRWKTEKLIKWIDEFNPDVIFYAAGDFIFSMEIALQIKRSKGIPMIAYFGDEYYFLEKSRRTFFSKINKKKYKATFSDVFSNISFFIAASDKMQRKYREQFNKPGYVIMKSTNINSIRNCSNDIKITYIGNLGLGRWEQLVEIGGCLKKMNQVLDVYSAESSQRIISRLNSDNGIRFHGSVSAKEAEEIMKSSTILIHVESMDLINRERTRYSMSTKIAECLGSGVCLFAYGPEDISSMEYLSENDAACVVTKKEDLKSRLQDILDDKQLREQYISNALELSYKRHNFETNTQLFYKMIVGACTDGEGNEDEDITSE